MEVLSKKVCVVSPTEKQKPNLSVCKEDPSFRYDNLDPKHEMSNYTSSKDFAVCPLLSNFRHCLKLAKVDLQ